MVSREAARFGAAIATLLSTACTEPAGRPQEVDLLAALPSAEVRAGSDVREAVRPDVVTVEGDSRTALVLRVPARVTWPIDLPFHAALRTASTVLPERPQDVTLRIGISDDRVYEDVARFGVSPEWQPQLVDLRDFSEWKFSLFYQPLRKTWRLVINAEGAPGGLVALDRPVITRSASDWSPNWMTVSRGIRPVPRGLRGR